MSVDPSYRVALSLVRLSPSHRTLAEQLVGLGIYLLVCLGALGLTQLSSPFYGLLPIGAYQTATFTYFLSLGLGMWVLWRSHSLRVSKLEFSLFLSQFLFQMAWSTSFFVGHQMLLALVALMLLWCNTLVCALLFWKKERVAGALLVFPLLWVFYLAGLNMMLC